jgi:chromosome segregation ATPase
MKKLMLWVVVAVFTFSVNAQNAQPDSHQPVTGTKAAKGDSKQSIKKNGTPANEDAVQRERAEIKAKVEELKIARLKQQHLQRTIIRDKEELKKQKAAADNFEEKIKRREKDLEAINNKIKEGEAAIGKLQTQASNHKKAIEIKAANNASD